MSPEQKYLAEPFAPQDMSDVERVFPAGVRWLMPDPKLIYGHDAPLDTPPMWREFQATWFFRGLESFDGLIPEKGIDKDVALRHLSAINNSWDPQHQHKEAAVNFLASRWFTKKSKWKARK